MEDSKHSFRKGFLFGGLVSLLIVSLIAVPLALRVQKTFRIIAEVQKIDEPLSTFREVRNKLLAKQVLDYDENDMLVNAVKAYVDNAGDKYSAFYTAEEWADESSSFTGSFYGIGVAVQQKTGTMETVIVTVYGGSGAEKAGLLAGDVIVSVDGTDVREMLLDDIVKLIRGEENSSVELGIERPSDEAALSFSVIRGLVESETAAAAMPAEGVGYIYLSQFKSGSAGQIEGFIRELKEQGMETLILDLRNNGGGLLSSTQEICGLFLSPGSTVLRMTGKDGSESTVETTGEPVYDGPLILLVNEYSASASEVTAGCLRDYGRALLFGRTTFGKGIVQTTYPLSDGSVLKLTTDYYLTPNGTVIHQTGLEPDFAAEDDPETPEIDEALETVLAYLKKQ